MALSPDGEHCLALDRDSDDECNDRPSQGRRPPVHPVTCMQDAFEESMVDAAEAEQAKERRLERTSSARTRRQRLLDNGDQDSDHDCREPYNARRRKTSRPRYHPLWKLAAQIIFAVHLLDQQLAKSDDEVSRILNAHVLEVDQFLENTTQDLDLALADIAERIGHLKLPLEHVNIFDTMLDDMRFRTSIVEGNEKIQRIMERTARAMKDAQVDVDKGTEAIVQLLRYLDRIQTHGAEHDERLADIYKTIRGRSERWLECLRNLRHSGSELGAALAQLGGILNEMTKRAGVAGRRSTLAHRTADVADSQSAPLPNTRSTARQNPRPRLVGPPYSPWALSRGTPSPGDKPLPRAPEPTVFAAGTLHRSQSRPPQKLHSIPLEQRFEHPRPPPQGPAPRSAVSQKDQRRQRTAEPRLETPVAPEWVSRASTPDASRATTPNVRSPIPSPVASGPASSFMPEPIRSLPHGPSSTKTSSNLRRRLSIRGSRKKPSSPMADSAYASGSPSSRSSDNERMLFIANPAISEGRRHLARSTFGLFAPSSSTTPALSIRSGVTGSTISKTNTLNTADSRSSSAITRPSTTTTTPSSTSSNHRSGFRVKRRSSLAGLRNILRRMHVTNKLGPTLESEAE